MNSSLVACRICGDIIHEDAGYFDKSSGNWLCSNKCYKDWKNFQRDMAEMRVI